MGEMADDALDRASRECELFDRMQDRPLQEQYEEGIIDETGSIIGNPGSIPGYPKDIF